MRFLFSIKNRIILVLILILQNSFADPLFLNQANPFPLYSSAGRYELLTRRARQEAIKFYADKNSDKESELTTEIFHISVMPFYQYANSGTNYRGEDKIDYVNAMNNNIIANNPAAAEELSKYYPSADFSAGNNNQASQTYGVQGGSAALVYASRSMPLSAIPEGFSFFPLLYNWNSYDSKESWLYRYSDAENFLPTQDGPPLPTGKTYGNILSKIIARSIGFLNIPAFPASEITNGASSGDTTAEVFDPLYYDYSNYRNPYFWVMNNPATRDPQRNFGYGYYDMEYNKVGIRSLIEFKPEKDYGIRIYTGFSNLDIDSIKCFDTTTTSQGPVMAYMYSRYADAIGGDQQTDESVSKEPWKLPNITPFVQYREPVTQPYTINNILTPYVHDEVSFTQQLPDQFKALYIQNMQNNLDQLGQILGQDFRPYYEQSFDDTTFEIFYRKMIMYNSVGKRVMGSKLVAEEEYPPYILMPTLAMHVTAPISPQIPGNKIFARPLGNNGHWEYGANIGCEFDFLNAVIFGCDFGFSWYSSNEYYNVPVPTKQLEEGIYQFKANFNKQPGYSFTLGVGMQAERFLDKFSFYGEYRLVRHNRDSFDIQSIVPLNIKVEYLVSQGNETATHTTNGNNDIPNAVLYLNEGQDLPYPEVKDVIVPHMIETSAWMVQMLNLTIKYDIMEDASLGIIWQQPFSMFNAINASTFGISFEMYI